MPVNEATSVDRALGMLCAEVRALGQRIDELRTDLRARSGDLAELDRRLRLVESYIASEAAARVTADRARARRHVLWTALLSGLSGVLGVLAARLLGIGR